MKRSIIIISLSFFFAGIFLSSGIFAENRAEKVLGESLSCLNIVNIRDTKILDDQTILFETSGGEVYINRLPAYCTGLRSADAFSYSTSLDRLCGVDIITVLEQGSSQGSRCGLGKFIKVKDVKNIPDAVKVLIDEGMLKELINEDAFKEAFPPEKSK
jgi:hypothetical protein